MSFATTPESAGYRTSIEQGIYSLYARRHDAEQAQVGREDEETRRIIDDMLQECYAKEAAEVGQEEASLRHGLRTQASDKS